MDEAHLAQGVFPHVVKSCEHLCCCMTLQFEFGLVICSTPWHVLSTCDVSSRIVAQIATENSAQNGGLTRNDTQLNGMLCRGAHSPCCLTFSVAFDAGCKQQDQLTVSTCSKHSLTKFAGEVAPQKGERQDARGKRHSQSLHLVSLSQSFSCCGRHASSAVS